MNRFFVYFIVACLVGPSFVAQSLPAQFAPSSIQDQIRRQQERMEQQRREMEERIRALRDRNPIPGRPNTRPATAPPPAQNSTQASETPGLQFEPGPITHSNGESVLVREEDGSTVVGRHHVSVGKTKIVLMPDGRLQPFEMAQTRPTEQKFVPLTISALEKQLLANPKLRGFKTLRSRRFLYVYNCSETFIQATRTIQESMYPAVKKWFGKSGINVRTPELPLVVIAFSTEDEYQNYRRMPSGVVAYYDTLSNNVFLYERSRLSDHAPEIAVKNAISTIAHEGAHQVLHNIGVQQRLSRWPMWLSEGLAEFFAPTSVVRGARWSGIGSSNQLRMMEISRDWQANSRPGSANAFGNGNRIRAVASADQLESLGYSYSWGLIHMAAKRHSRELYQCIRECHELRPLDGTPAVRNGTLSALEVFESHFGKDYANFEQEMYKHLSKLSYVDPVNTQTHYIVISSGRVVMTTSPEKVKELQRLGRATVKRYPNRATAEREMKKLTN